MDNQWWSSPIVSVRTRMLNITGMLLQSHCGDEEDGAMGCLHVTFYLKLLHKIFFTTFTVGLKQKVKIMWENN